MSADHKPITRRCGTCFAYDHGECLNAMGTVAGGDRCDLHKTRREDRRDTANLNRYRAALGLPPLRL